MTESGSGHPGGHPGGHAGGLPGGHPGGESRGGDQKQYFDEAYQGTAPWDIGRPQPVFVELEAEGGFGHRVLDIGCGTGENALYLASEGHDVTGVDAAESAIERASAKAAERGITARFVAEDFFVAAEGPDLGGSFDSAIDCGFFHALDDAQRVRFAAALARLLAPGGLYAMLAFSDRVPGTFGPRRVSEAEIRGTFSGPEWRVLEDRPVPLHTAMPSMPVLDGNLALVERV